MLFHFLMGEKLDRGGRGEAGKSNHILEGEVRQNSPKFIFVQYVNAKCLTATQLL